MLCTVLCGYLSIWILITPSSALFLKGTSWKGETGWIRKISHLRVYTIRAKPQYHKTSPYYIECRCGVLIAHFNKEYWHRIWNHSNHGGLTGWRWTENTKSMDWVPCASNHGIFGPPIQGLDGNMVDRRWSVRLFNYVSWRPITPFLEWWVGGSHRFYFLNDVARSWTHRCIYETRQLWRQRVKNII